jgi:hypothetical protein
MSEISDAAPTAPVPLARAGDDGTRGDVYARQDWHCEGKQRLTTP